MTTSGSPSSTSSQRTWTWTRTDWKHLQRSEFSSTPSYQNKRQETEAEERTDLKRSSSWSVGSRVGAGRKSWGDRVKGQR